jgi:hypothetical protein
MGVGRRYLDYNLAGLQPDWTGCGLQPGWTGSATWLDWSRNLWLATNRLFKSGTHRDPFQRKQKDTFQFNAPDIGALTKLKVWHNNGRSLGGMFKSTDPSWHLQEIHVSMAQKGQNVVFPANRWLAKGKDDGLLEAYLTSVASYSAVTRSSTPHHYIPLLPLPTNLILAKMLQRFQCDAG